MNKITPFTRINRIIPVALGLPVWVFFAFFYRHHLHYHEQLQLFLTTSDYFWEHVRQPGGLAIYLGGFVTQFFVDAVWGGFLIALILTGMQQLTALLARRSGGRQVYEPLTCLPSVLYVFLLCDENAMLSGLVALSLALMAAAIYVRIPGYARRVVFLLGMTPVLYWLLGMSCAAFYTVCLFFEWTNEESKRYRIHNAGLTLLSFLLLLLAPLTAKTVLGNMPPERFLFAGNYYRFVAYYQMSFFWMQLSVVAVLALIRWLPAVAARKTLRVQMAQLLLVGLFAGWGINRLADWKKEDVMAYDYYARSKKWEHIVGMADRQSPDGPLTVMTLNLALGKTGYLADHLFSYFQNGPEGLLPSFSRDYISAVMIGEVYYYLGLVNTAQHFTFEAMETIPDHQKSVRCLKRLAETNLINGRYAVAAKYLNLLKHTLFYRKWAMDATTYLYNDERIDAHPEWGLLRRFRPGDDFFFSEEEKDQMLGILFQQDPDNRMAYEYLMAWTLLNKDLARFPVYFAMGQRKFIHPVVPKSYQEALAYLWSMEPDTDTPAQVNRSVLQRMHNYRHIYISFDDPELSLRKDYGDTFWYYLQFRRN